MPRIEVGVDVYVREPQRFESGCISITGTVTAIDGEACTVAAYVARPWVPGIGSLSELKTVTVPLAEVGRQIGTPVSALSGRPGAAGYAEFTRIARSWGCP
ncbi:hypothetical protein [Methylobacterium radiodurans]|uniref:Uncharacterized protein n=1 Tax=Methylobacterium radiodurans TaxID=2202828 RepID=A0A2U8VQU4_9HYPH|nr:hypothetical protein [Methylobacterium radiodurans]AWN35682.1 hypothetical protein DK427_07945 [Methylobacterium radiodurans]